MRAYAEELCLLLALLGERFWIGNVIKLAHPIDKGEDFRPNLGQIRNLPASYRIQGCR